VGENINISPLSVHIQIYDISSNVVLAKISADDRKHYLQLTTSITQSPA